MSTWEATAVAELTAATERIATALERLVEFAEEETRKDTEASTALELARSQKLPVPLPTTTVEHVHG